MIRQSDAAIQLRRHYNGESSATLLDLLAGGVRVITNLINYDYELFELITSLPADSRGATLHQQIARALDTMTLPDQPAVDSLFAKRDPDQIIARMLS